MIENHIYTKEFISDDVPVSVIITFYVMVEFDNGDYYNPPSSSRKLEGIRDVEIVVPSGDNISITDDEEIKGYYDWVYGILNDIELDERTLITNSY